MKFFCENCNCNKPSALINGYTFGDRLMEGVMFKVNTKGEFIGFNNKHTENYMKQFNMELWKKRCEETAKTYDIFECPDCGDDIYIDD